MKDFLSLKQDEIKNWLGGFGKGINQKLLYEW
jgi:hypothetical protein